MEVGFDLSVSLLLSQQHPKERWRDQEAEHVGTGARAAIHALLLADLLDVEAVAGCRAGLGALTVLHPNWTLGD